MSENAVPYELGPKTLDFTGVTVIGLPTGAGLVSINGDTTPAQLLAAGQGLQLADAGALHSYAVKLAPAPTGLGFDPGGGLFIAAESPIFLDPILDAVAVGYSMGITANVFGPNLELTGLNIFLRKTPLTLVPGVNNDVSLIDPFQPHPCSHVYIDTGIGAPITITGFDYNAVYPIPQLPQPSTDLYVTNLSGFPVTFADQTGSNPAANQIFTGYGADVTVPDNCVVHFLYDTNKLRWHLTYSSIPITDLATQSIAIPFTVVPAVPVTFATITIPSAGTYLVCSNVQAPLIGGTTQARVRVIETFPATVLIGTSSSNAGLGASLSEMAFQVVCDPITFIGGEIITAELQIDAGAPTDFVGSIWATRIGT